MAKVMIGLMIGVVVFGGKMLLHPSMPDTLAGREEFLAKGINATAPVAVGPYSSITGATADKGVLQINVRLSSTAPKISMDNSFMHGVALGACKNSAFSDLVNRGGAVSFVFTNADGQVLPPATVSNCPIS